MNVFNSFLEQRDASRQSGREVDAWMLSVHAPAERLLAFDGWVRAQLEKRLQWPGNERARVKLLHQCRDRMERLVLELWRREWLLDGPRLAKHVIAALDDVAAAQRAGRVKDFWPFFCRVIDGYVGLNAEEIQREARAAAGTKSAAVVGELLKASLGRTATLPELVAQRRDELTKAKGLRAELAAERKRRKAAQAEAGGTLELF